MKANVGGADKVVREWIGTTTDVNEQVNSSRALEESAAAGRRARREMRSRGLSLIAALECAHVATNTRPARPKRGAHGLPRK